MPSQAFLELGHPSPHACGEPVRILGQAPKVFFKVLSSLAAADVLGFPRAQLRNLLKAWLLESIQEMMRMGILHSPVAYGIKVTRPLLRFNLNALS